MRLQNWQSRFYEEIEAAKLRPFSWGSHDCCLFAADIVKKIADVDYAESFRGTYETELQAARILKEHGGCEGIANKFLGQAIPILTAQRGDVVLVIYDDRDSLGICAGAICYFAGLKGLEKLPLNRCLKAWRV